MFHRNSFFYHFCSPGDIPESMHFLGNEILEFYENWQFSLVIWRATLCDFAITSEPSSAYWKIMVCSVPSGQLVFSSRPVVKTVRYFRPLVGTSGQLGEYFVRRVRQFMRPSPSWRGEMYQKRFFNLLTRGQCMFMHCYFVSGPTEN